ncbi:MAG: hypothetical protein AAF756_16930 [Pseudomonadota bacterium]
MLFTICVTVKAGCVDVVDIATELPQNELTPNRIGIFYSYDLRNEQYRISWSREQHRGGPYGPFMLTRGCAPASLHWESNDFLLFHAGCGTFCWYVLAIPLKNTTEPYQKFERPLAFDQERSLLAFYAARDVIRVKSLVTGQEQEIRTAYNCEMASGLCFEAVRFTKNKLEYRWRHNPTGRVFAVSLNDQLIGPD